MYTFDKTKQCIGTMTIEIDFLQKKNIDSNPYDTDKMAAEFIQQFNSQAFSVGQQVGCALGPWGCTGLKQHRQAWEGAKSSAGAG